MIFLHYTTEKPLAEASPGDRNLKLRIENANLSLPYTVILSKRSAPKNPHLKKENPWRLLEI